MDHIGQDFADAGIAQDDPGFVFDQRSDEEQVFGALEAIAEMEGVSLTPPASKSYVSPTGSAIIGTLEVMTCRCEILGINDDGTPEYAGGSTLFYDETKPVERDGKPLFLDEAGASWTFYQLTAVLS